MTGGRIIDILLKETDTQWMFTLTGTCAEIEDDENVPTKKGETAKSDKVDGKSDTPGKTSKDGADGDKEGGTTDEPPPTIKGKPLSKDVSTETDGGEIDEKEPESEKDVEGESADASVEDTPDSGKNCIFKR